MSYCDDCGMTRPRWHGGAHKCIKVGDLIYYAHIGSLRVSERELGFLGVPERTAQ